MTTAQPHLMRLFDARVCRFKALVSAVELGTVTTPGGRALTVDAMRAKLRVAARGWTPGC
jgi:hypothetical protein